MILDAVAAASRYRGTHPAVDRALVLLDSVPWLKLEDGRHELAEGVHAILSSYTTAPPEESRYEGHRRFADLQLILQGLETIWWVPAADLQAEGEYDPGGDLLYFRDPAETETAAAPIRVRPGLFLLLYPEDAHKPGRIWGSPGPVRKAVLKVRL